MKSLFDPVVDDVVKLVNAQALKVRKLCQETKVNAFAQVIESRCTVYFGP